MEANEYQAQAARTLIAESAVPHFALMDLAAIVTVLKLSIELSEHLDRLKKRVFHEHSAPLPETTSAFLEHIALRARNLAAFLDTDGPLDRESFSDLQRNKYQVRLLWNVTGLVGEAGETARMILDHLEGEPLNPADIIKELGDGNWYEAALCSVLDLQLSDVLAANITKLQIRYPDGWDTAASQARMDLQS